MANTEDQNQYNKTLNLPSTDFPMRGNLPQNEPKTLSKWKELNIYQKIIAQNKDKQNYILHDGPPYANGDIHLGHAVNKILKDIVVKSQTFNGKCAPYIPGWDCHGLPIELNVEKKYGKVGSKISAKEFRQKCREYAQSQIEKQMQGFIRLGVMGDWQNYYHTKDFQYEADILLSLAKIYKNGHIHRGTKPVYWSIGGHSALAEAEVEYKDKESNSIYTTFEIVKPKELISKFQTKDKDITQADKIEVLIWTTTPWTIPLNEAVCLHPKLEYNIFYFNKINRYILMSENLGGEFAKLIATDYKKLGKIQGDKLELIQVRHPIYKNKLVPLILGKHVTDDIGTGCVHVAPAHGDDDFKIAMKYGLNLSCRVDDRGYYFPEVPLMQELNVLKADELVIQLLQNNNNLLYHSKFKHSYPFCWRTKTPLIYRTTPQWFISMDQKELRNKALATIVEDVQWIPPWGQQRIETMIKDRPDWCISRQRFWGVPIAIFIHYQTAEPHPNTYEIMLKVADLIKKDGIDAWFEMVDTTKQELLGNDAANYKQVADILDVWFDSGVSHQAVLQRRLSYPADMYLEGSDQHRGWFQSSLLSAIAVNDGKTSLTPYKRILTHGFTVDKDGKKMSKSLGNGVEPQDIIKKFGADILRLWIASSDYKYEMTISDEVLSRITDSYRRIRNTARFLLSNIFDLDKKTIINLNPNHMTIIDKWVLHRAENLQQEIIQQYNEYNFHQIYQLIHNFCINDLGGFYFDLVKDRQYTAYKSSTARLSAQTTMYHLLNYLVRWIAPILSFTAEEIYQKLKTQYFYKKDSVFLNTWYQDDSLKKIIDAYSIEKEYGKDLIAFLSKQKSFVAVYLEAQRKEGKIKGTLPCELTILASGKTYNVLNKIKMELKFVFLTSQVTLKKLEEGIDKTGYFATENPQLLIKVKISNQKKCVRCWHYNQEVGQNKEHPNLCARCITNLIAPGEKRYFC